MTLDAEKELTEDWLKLKWGKFSASQLFHLMMGSGKGMFGDGAITYIEGIARECYTRFNTDELVETYAMKMGKVNEAQSFGVLYKHIGFAGLQYHGSTNPVFELYTGFDNPELDGQAGASPDATAPLLDGTGFSFGAELKNPKQKTHWEYLRNIKDQWDLKKISLEYYTQVQMSMLTFKTDLWIWASYNEYFPVKHQMRIVEVVPDIPFLEDFKVKLKMAIRLRNKIVKEMQDLA
jgi:hypothetical protein